MQSWGGHTYEDFRPSHVFPTRSGVVGLLGACLGVTREDISKRNDLNDSFKITVKVDRAPSIKIRDYHTVLDAPTVKGEKRDDAIVSQREYLCDAKFTIILDFYDNAIYGLDILKKALDKPIFTPFLGRRSCPLHRPLFEKVISAESLEGALKKLPTGTIYSEDKNIQGIPMEIRDVPLKSHVRRFANRMVYIKGKE